MGGTGISGVEGRDAAQNYSMQRTAPTAQNDLSPNVSSTPNVNSAKGENFALELTCELVFVKH